jgi:hypothetical protein
VNRSAIAVGAVLMLCGVGLLALGVRGVLSGEVASGGDLAAGFVLSALLLVLGFALAGFESGREYDDRRRVIVHWTRWRGFKRRQTETPFDAVRRLTIVYTAGAKYSPATWSIVAELTGGRVPALFRSIDLEESLAEGRAIAGRIGAEFPAGRSEWSGRDGEVNCTVSLNTGSLGAVALTVGEYTDDPHQLNDSMTVTLDEYRASDPHGRGAVARGIIRDRLGAAVATEVDEAICARSISQQCR